MSDKKSLMFSIAAASEDAATELKEVMQNTDKLEVTLKKADESGKKFSERMKKLVNDKVIVPALKKVGAAFVDWTKGLLKTNDETRSAISNVKGALLTMVQPLAKVIIPAFTLLANVATRIIYGVAQVLAKLFGTTVEESSAAAEALYEEVDALDSTGTAAKKAAKNFSSLDEINSWNSGEAGDPDTSSKTIEPNFDTTGMKGIADELVTYFSGALLAIGAILTFTGVNLPLGIGLMAAGAIGLASQLSLDWNLMPDSIQKALTIMLGILSFAALAIGAILVFTGTKLPLGIGLLAAGAVSLGTAAALNWNTIIDALRGTIGVIAAIVSGALLVVGAILAFTGANISLGIGLMAVGAVALGAIVTLNWDTITNAMRGTVGKITAIVSGALLVLGAVLALTGANIPLGLALLGAGAAGLITAAAFNWDTTVGIIKTTISGIMAVLSGSLLVLGVLLCLSGAGLGLGLALIAAGLAGSYAAWKIDDNPVTSFVRKMANGIINIINGVIDKINEMLHITSNGFSIAGKQIIPPFSHQLFKIPRIPQLATGAVIPPNREFLAILGDQRSGTNIETPEGLLRQIMREELGGRGNTYQVNATANGRNLFRLVIDEAKGEQMRTGRNPFMLT